ARPCPPPPEPKRAWLRRRQAPPRPEQRTPGLCTTARKRAESGTTSPLWAAFSDNNAGVADRMTACITEVSLRVRLDCCNRLSQASDRVWPHQIHSSLRHVFFEYRPPGTAPFALLLPTPPEHLSLSPVLLLRCST